jgi:hypothetical protein
MSTLTYSERHVAPSAEATRTPRRPSLWRRFYTALCAAQQRRAEREIARYLAAHGGLMTDDMEREMMRRLSGTRNLGTP